MQTHIIGAQKHIALIAHDHKKDDLISWVQKNDHVLKPALSVRYRHHGPADHRGNGAAGEGL